MDANPRKDCSFLETRAQGLAERDGVHCHTLNGFDLLGTFNLFDDLNKHSIIPILWSPLEKIYTLLTPFGRPALVYPSSSYVAIGTSRGNVVIFSHKQYLQVVLTPGDDCPVSKITQICASVDGTHIAAGLQSGDVVIWNLNAKSRSEGTNGCPRELNPILHIPNHKPHEITGLGFMSERHTAVIVSDKSGSITCHSAFRNHIWRLAYNTTIISAPGLKTNEVLATATYPGSLGLAFSDTQPMALLSCSHISLISETNLEICFHREIKMGSGSHVQIVWSTCGTKLCYIKGKHLEVIYFKRGFSTSKIETDCCSEWHGQEMLESVEWLTEDSIAVLTESRKFIVFNSQQELQLFETVDFQPVNVLNPPEKSFACFKKQVFVLSSYCVQIGSFLSWSDIVLRFVQRKAFLSALKSVAYFLVAENLPTDVFGLQKCLASRRKQLAQPLRNLSIASIRHFLVHNNEDSAADAFMELVMAILATFALVFKDEKDISVFIEQVLELISKPCWPSFLEVILDLVLRKEIRILTPSVSSELLKYASDQKSRNVFADLVLKLDPSSLDINLAVKICQKLGLTNEIIYLWTSSSWDCISPLVDLLFKLSNQTNKCQLIPGDTVIASQLTYDYVSFIMTGREFPVGKTILPHSLAFDLKLQMCFLLFNGTIVDWPPTSGIKLYTTEKHVNEPTFPYMDLLLKENCCRCLAMLHEILEDAFFDDDRIPHISTQKGNEYRLRVSRQFVIDLLLDKIKESSSLEEKVPIAIFITRNFPKYPQFIRLSNHVILELVLILCSEYPPWLFEDAQRSLESLFAVYDSSEANDFIPSLKKKKFNRPLFLIYKHQGAYAHMLELCAILGQEEVCANLLDTLEFGLQHSLHDHTKKKLLYEVIKTYFETVIEQDMLRVIGVFEKYDTDLHNNILDLRDQQIQYSYLHEYFQSTPTLQLPNFELFCQYVVLLCILNYSDELCQVLNKATLSSIQCQKIYEILQEHTNTRGSVIIQRKMNDFEGAIESIVQYLDRSNTETACEKSREQFRAYGEFAIETCLKAGREQSKACWTKFLIFLLSNYGSLSRNQSETYALMIQRVFESLSKQTAFDTDKGSKRLIGNVLTSTLESQDVILAKVREIAPLFKSVLNSSELEENISHKILEILNRSSFSIINQYEEILQSGWSINYNDCEICGKKIWGVGISSGVFIDWERVIVDTDKSTCDSGKFGSQAFVVFSCHHGFHRRCLENLGQQVGAYKCLLCL
ncbi:LAQU0S07e02718g1_1 [Lachancea quebecensis]|uniref:LAQU0S07e02718g1_1 n=1 Tax=Lachancea quebecensis TaxID=1654605 RepID=A0A0P1KSP4_9SACH|nr:LAQU0S07e02718g1_1 [Lachancea quebecensis]